MLLIEEYNRQSMFSTRNKSVEKHRLFSIKSQNVSVCICVVSVLVTDLCRFLPIFALFVRYENGKEKPRNAYKSRHFGDVRPTRFELATFRVGG